MEKTLSFKTKFFLTILFILAIFLLLLTANNKASDYLILILNLMAINIIFAVSLTFINGITGIFSLGHVGFIAIGAYVSSILTLSPAQKEISYLIEPLIYPLNVIQIPFLPAIIIAGLVAAAFGYLVAAPSLRLIGDYLAIATLGLGEVVRVVANNTWSITNGALGLKSIPQYSNLWWTWGFALITIVFISSLVQSSYGRALKAIREDSVAAKSMGINVFSHQVVTFVIGSFFAGVGGALWAHLITTIDPKSFMFQKTFEILIMVVIGGLGSISGAIIGASLYTVGLEFLRVLEEPISIGPIYIPGIPGMRMVVLSLILIIIMLFWRRGIMGRHEITWDGIYKLIMKVRNKNRMREDE